MRQFPWLVLVSSLALAEVLPVDIVIRDQSTRQVLPGALVSEPSLGVSAVTDLNGAVRLDLPKGKALIRVSLPGFKERELTLDVQPGLPLVEIALEIQPLQLGQEMVVLGTRKPRTLVASPVPVDVLSRDAIESSGYPETSQAIQFLAPSFNFSTSTISDGTDIVRPSTLRGMGPDQTLVLVNGRRRHNSALVHVNGSVGRGSAGVDLNAIPASAIARVEVLRDGASAQYGSDAIAGALNIALRSDVGHTDLEAQIGQTSKSDGEILDVSLNRGWSVGNRGFIHATLEVRDRGATNRAGRDPRQQYNSLPDGSPDPRESTFDRLNHRYGDADSDNAYLFLNGAFGRGDQGEFYVHGGISDRDGESGGFYRRALDARTIPELHPDGFLPLINTSVKDQSLTLGYRDILGDWALDASSSWGHNSFGYVISNSNNVSLGPDSPTEADAGELGFSQWTNNIDLLRGFALGGGATLAIGLEWRRDAYEITAGEPASYIDGGQPDQFGGRAAPGIQVFPGFQPQNEVDENRDNLGVYAELSGSASPHLDYALAARFEDYSDFGQNLSWKASARYEINAMLALRSALSTGFRAPSLHQSHFNNISTQFQLNDQNDLVPFEVGTFRSLSPVTRAFGIPELKEETSFNASVGLTFKPSDRFLMTLDYFAIDVDDRIVITGTFRASADPRIADILDPFDVASAQFFSNAVNTQTRGADLVMAYAMPLQSEGRLRVTAAVNWNQTRVVGDVQTPPALAEFGEVLFDRTERERIESAQPGEAGNLSLEYRRPSADATLRFSYFGSVKTADSASNPELDQVYSAKWLTDLDLGYRLRDSLRLSIGAHNLFDVYPDKNREELSFNGIFVYPRRTAPFGFNGASFYGQIAYRF